MFWLCIVALPLAVVLGGAVLMAGFARRGIVKGPSGVKVEYLPRIRTVFLIAFLVFALPRALIVWELADWFARRTAMRGDDVSLRFFVAPDVCLAAMFTGGSSPLLMCIVVVVVSVAWAAALAGLTAALRGLREAGRHRLELN